MTASKLMMLYSLIGSSARHTEVLPVPGVPVMAMRLTGILDILSIVVFRSPGFIESFIYPIVLFHI